MKTVTIKNLNEDLVLKAKKVVKESGWQWEYYLRHELEKQLTEMVETSNVEKTILKK